MNFPTGGVMRRMMYCYNCQKFTRQLIQYEGIEEETIDGTTKHYIVFYQTCFKGRDDDGILTPQPKKAMISLSQWNSLCRKPGAPKAPRKEVT